jgi:hypothetical protein
MFHQKKDRNLTKDVEELMEKRIIGGQQDCLSIRPEATVLQQTPTRRREVISHHTLYPWRYPPTMRTRPSMAC